MPTNQEIINKAAMTLSDLSAGGQMNTQQARKFIKMLIDTPTVLNECRTVQMESDSRKIEKIGFGTRILRPGIEGTPLEEEQKSKPTLGKIQLNAKEVIAEVNITYDTLENNIEGKNLKNTIMKLIADRAALDIEELIINGDTTSADPYLKLIDGIRKQSISHIVDWKSAAVGKDLFKNAIKRMPVKYRRDKRNMRFYVSDNTETEWIDIIGNRATTAGDSALTGGKVYPAYGVPVKGISMLLPYDNGTEKDVTDGIFTHPKNIATGISRNISVEVDKDIRARMFIIVLTMKLDVKFEEEDAVVKMTKILE
jgi:HK97 family phage major capsid protein